MSGSKLVKWHIENFMSIEKADISFATPDNPNNSIISIKGYNDSGKSAVLTTLKVLLTNAYPTKQVGFIQDGKDFFRVMAFFDDGVVILRDKYANGQSLMEMYKDKQLLFSTKQGNTLTKVSEVPQVIKDYLGLIEFDGTCLNSRSCFEKQIGVQTTGSENYKMFNTVLKSEEIALASEHINTDKNAVMKSITSINAQIEANKDLLGRGAKITDGMLKYLKETDEELELTTLKEDTLNNIKSISNAKDSIIISPEIDEIDNKKLEALQVIEQITEQIKGIKVAPEVAEIENNKLNSLSNIENIVKQLADIKVAPEVKEINNDKVTTLQAILNIAIQLGTVTNDIKAEEERLLVLSNELDKMQKELQNFGVKLVKCPDCGCVFDPSVGHID